MQLLFCENSQKQIIYYIIYFQLLMVKFNKKYNMFFSKKFFLYKQIKK